MTTYTKAQIIRALQDDDSGCCSKIYEDGTVNWGDGRVTARMTGNLQAEGYLAVSTGDDCFIRADLVDGNTHVHKSLR